MALFSAEVGHIDEGSGIGGEQAEDGAGGCGLQRFAKAQDRQGAEEVSGVDIGHVCVDRGTGGLRPRECDCVAP